MSISVKNGCASFVALGVEVGAIFPSYAKNAVVGDSRLVVVAALAHPEVMSFRPRT